jgi:hypothetical protein
MPIEVSVTYDAKRGYVASAPELREPVVALSLGGLRRKIEALMFPTRAGIILQLDGLAERERHRRLVRRATGAAPRTFGYSRRDSGCARR